MTSSTSVRKFSATPSRGYGRTRASCRILALAVKGLMPEPQEKTMKKSILATLALAGASVMFAAPQSNPPTPTKQPVTKARTSQTKKTRHKKEPKHQQTPQSPQHK